MTVHTSATMLKTNTAYKTRMESCIREYQAMTFVEQGLAEQLRSAAQCSVQPFKIEFAPRFYRQNQKFRDLMRLDFAEGCFKRGQLLSRRLDQKQNFGCSLDRFLPPVDRGQIGDQADAGGEAAFDQGLRDAICRIRGVGGGQDDTGGFGHGFQIRIFRLQIWI